MEYQLVITAYEKNPDFKPHENSGMTGFDYRQQNERQYEYERKNLSVRISEEQFNAIRKAVLEKF